MKEPVEVRGFKALEKIVEQLRKEKKRKIYCYEWDTRSIIVWDRPGPIVEEFDKYVSKEVHLIGFLLPRAADVKEFWYSLLEGHIVMYKVAHPKTRPVALMVKEAVWKVLPPYFFGYGCAKKDFRYVSEKRFRKLVGEKRYSIMGLEHNFVGFSVRYVEAEKKRFMERPIYGEVDKVKP